MKNLKKYEGIFPALYACYDEEGKVSGERIQAFVTYLKDKGVQGLYVNGSSGECIYQSVEERKFTLEKVMEVKGDLVIIAHVACNNTADSMELAKHAESLGVDAIAAIPPIYFHLPDYAMAQYWNRMSEAAPHTDFMIYNIPQLAGVALTKGLYKTMLENPRVIGVKNSSPSVQDIQEFKAIGGEECVVFNGPDEHFVAGRIMGASGGIGGTYAAMPELFLEADKAFKEGDVERAQAIQFAIDEIIASFFRGKSNMYAIIKEILRRKGVEIGGVREPLPAFVPEDDEVVVYSTALIEKAIQQFCQ
ncbi:MAG: dihydrodipicolinate synthase family protein [Cellulosilyticaceae bacterium]